MITDDEVRAAYQVALDEAKRWRTVGMRGVQGCYLIRDVAAPESCLKPAEPVEEVEHLRFDNEQLAGEYIQWRMIKAVLEWQLQKTDPPTTE